MPLRTTTLESGPRNDPRTPEEWQRLVARTTANGERAVRAGDEKALASLYEEVAGWGDEQRAFQGRLRLTEIVFSASAQGNGGAWMGLYATAAEALLTALLVEPREPMQLNYAGVLLYELDELRGAELLFKAAKRLDPELPYLKGNLDALQQRKRWPKRARHAPALAARIHTLSGLAGRAAGRAQTAKGLKISLCMIVKDEEEMLPGCLEPVKDAVNEIVIVDTGSSDRTIEIAESFGARVISFPWNGSFSDARNVSLDAATGDWVIYLDADEHMQPEDAPLLRALAGRTWREGFYLVETNYTGGDEAGSAVTHMAMRMFRNRPAYRFEGRIHEQKTAAMPTYMSERFEMTNIRLCHYGYLKSVIDAREKSARNLELLEQEEREAHSPFTSFNVGSEYLALGRIAEAREHFERSWVEIKQIPNWSTVGYASILLLRLIDARRENGAFAEAREAIAEGLSVYPDHTDLFFQLALCAHDEGDHEAAAELAERCLAMGDSDARYAATMGTGSFLALSLLADVRRKQGRKDEAEQLLRRSLEEHPDYVAPFLTLANLVLDRGGEVAELEALVPEGRVGAMLFAGTALLEHREFEAAERWFRRTLEQQPSNGVARIGLTESYLSQRRYDEAIDEARREDELSPTLAAALGAELFAAAASGEAAKLDCALAHAESVLPELFQLPLYRAWMGLMRGENVSETLPATCAPTALQALEALLRVQELERFGELHELFGLTEIDERTRHEALARMYLRRGFLESAADEWIQVASELPDADALIGLAQVALAQGLPDDARVFAAKALDLEPDDTRAKRVLAGA